MKKTILFLMAFVMSLISYAQQYTDYLGGGHNNGITVTTSHDQATANDGGKSVDGFPVSDAELLQDASRFLAQATLGYDYNEIELVATMGYEAWLEEQFSVEWVSMLDQLIHLVNTFPREVDEEGNPIMDMCDFRSAWWEKTLRRPDLLRQKINYLLSQIMVVSGFGSDLFEDVGHLSASYYDALGANAFGNYKELLSAVSLHPSMGLYLNHMNNPKSDPANNIHPDENYAREVMQLFSIGLYELENDGTRKVGTNGAFIPTYDNDDIREFAKVFTGFGDGHSDGQWLLFGEEDVFVSSVLPMKMYEQHHEPGEKKLLNGQVIPAGQTGMQDFNAAMDNLSNHPNVGPFIGKALIQMMVSANPSPEYVNRVATAFNNNGQGQRGDMKAVIKAILLDPEARACNATSHPTRGKLREPLVRYAQFLKAFYSKPEGATLCATMFERWYPATGQVPLYSPSVFNFYLPEFQPNGPIANQNLVGPVFQIHNSSTSIGFINEVDLWTFEEDPLLIDEELFPGGQIPEDLLDYSEELSLTTDPTELVNRLDILLAAGQLSDQTKSIIVNAVSSLDDELEQVQLAVYLVMISPDYAVLK